MIESGLILPERAVKPRESGLTILIDNGAPLNLFLDTIHSSSVYIDFVKFGWGTSLITPLLEHKIEALIEHDIDFFFGGTLFEKYLSQGKTEDYFNFCQRFHCSYVEISNGTVTIPNREKAKYIKDFSREFFVFSEVGNKDNFKADNQESSEWVEDIHEDLEAGASKVITEARESGTSGICMANGDIRNDIFEEIIESGISIDKLIFEAPNKKMQTFFIRSIGSNVNLANIAFSDVISLESLRLGLRSDTFNI
ncbi:phosphosulfolactate synthase [Oceanobacillus piezotolerans]|uniref:Phosphosulfolactate synthase n=1 Tax=Oceanobacillus piezotolerans TaxID=2448030 RepID=A0A498D9W7_9BACI|nr:phosphosulfolactate synthase [Oceanobacillus piezotolerans]RLL43730.1 phosphosulfolactate synthase [Oceanobacillus piezotolerans]